MAKKNKDLGQRIQEKIKELKFKTPSKAKDPKHLEKTIEKVKKEPAKKEDKKKDKVTSIIEKVKEKINKQY